MVISLKAEWSREMGKPMIFIQIGTTLILLIFITLIVLEAHKKLNAEDKIKFKRELLFETGILFVGHSLLVIAVIFLYQILINISIILILVGWFYQGILMWKENRNRSIFLFILILISAYISFIFLN